MVASLLAAQHGAISAAEVLACGASRRDLAGLVCRGELTRVRRGALVDSAAYRVGTPEKQMALTTMAVLRSLRPGPKSAFEHALSHESALVVRGAPMWGLGGRHVHVARLQPGRLSSGSGVNVHVPVPSECLCTVGGGMPSVTAALAVVQTAQQHGVEAAVVPADHAVRKGWCTKDELIAALGVPERPGLAARRAVAMSDGASESAGESRARVLFAALGLPEPELQVRFEDEESLIGRVDFLFRGLGVIAEFDGKVKYVTSSSSFSPSSDAPDLTLWQEKRREDRLRELGYEVVRIVWADLAAAAGVHARIRAAAGRSRRRTVPLSVMASLG